MALLSSALLFNVSVADAEPLLDGEKTTSTAVVFPAAIVSGNEGPEMVKLELLLDTDVTLTLAPVAVRLNDWAAVLPTLTLPNFNGLGATLS